MGYSCVKASGGGEVSTVHLPLTFHWYDETESGRKRIEYRSMETIDKKLRIVPSKWMRDIWEKRSEITHVRFSRAYTKTIMLFRVEKIDIGPCPIEGWTGDYIRIYFADL